MNLILWISSWISSSSEVTSDLVLMGDLDSSIDFSSSAFWREALMGWRGLCKFGSCNNDNFSLTISYELISSLQRASQLWLLA